MTLTRSNDLAYQLRFSAYRNKPNPMMQMEMGPAATRSRREFSQTRHSTAVARYRGPKLHQAGRFQRNEKRRTSTQAGSIALLLIRVSRRQAKEHELADHTSEIFLCHAQFEDRGGIAVRLLHLDGIGVLCGRRDFDLFTGDIRATFLPRQCSYGFADVAAAKHGLRAIARPRARGPDERQARRPSPHGSTEKRRSACPRSRPTA